MHYTQHTILGTINNNNCNHADFKCILDNQLNLLILTEFYLRRTCRMLVGLFLSLNAAVTINDGQQFATAADEEWIWKRVEV